MRKLFLILLCSSFFTAPAFATEGMISIQSAHSVPLTADRLEKILSSRA